MIIKPEISVIFSVEGSSEEALKSSIDSILFQSFLDLELILIDDRLSRSFTKICQAYARQDGRVKHIKCIYRFKTTAEYHTYGAQISTGNYLYFISKNDTWHDNALLELHQDHSPSLKRRCLLYDPKGVKKWTKAIQLLGAYAYYFSRHIKRRVFG